ncbi:MAG: hypothetical protein ABI190_10370 [Casimicrobiaceae bacterium]
MNRLLLVLFASMLTLGGTARAQDLKLGTMSLEGRGLVSVFLVPEGGERCVVEVRDSTGTRVQAIEPEGLDCKEHWWARAFATKDMNFDGFADFGFTAVCGNRNCSCNWYLYNPVSSRFEASSALADVSCDVRVDRKAKTLTFGSRGSMNSENVDTYKWRDTELALVRQEVNLMVGPDPDANVCVVTQIVSELRQAGMVKVSRTCKLNGEPCSCDKAISIF